MKSYSLYQLCLASRFALEGTIYPTVIKSSFLCCIPHSKVACCIKCEKWSKDVRRAQVGHDRVILELDHGFHCQSMTPCDLKGNQTLLIFAEQDLLWYIAIFLCGDPLTHGSETACGAMHNYMRKRNLVEMRV